MGLFRKKANKETYKPTFGTAEEFTAKIPVGSGTPFGNSIFVVNDNAQSIANQCILPTLEKKNLSYLVYDRDGSYYNEMHDSLLEAGYDAQLIDLADDSNPTRIDIFETANIMHNAYWLAIILSSSIKCTPVEVISAHNLFMALMQYLLAADGTITMETLKELFDKYRAEDKLTIQVLHACSESRVYASKFEQAPPDMKASVFKKANGYFFQMAFNKIAKSNVFAITVPNKKTAYFIKEVPAKYRFIMTAFMFNVKVVNRMQEGSSIRTLILDDAMNCWYNRPLIEKVCDEIGDKMLHGVVTISIVPKIELEAGENVIVYMQSKDENTNNAIYEHIKVKNMYTEEEKLALAKSQFKKKSLPDSALELAPMSIEEMRAFDGCIVINTAKTAKPFTCERQTYTGKN